MTTEYDVHYGEQLAKAREVLDNLKEFFSDPRYIVARKLVWCILSALRGPDAIRYYADPNYDANKHVRIEEIKLKTTAVIRNRVLPFNSEEPFPALLSDEGAMVSKSTALTPSEAEYDIMMALCGSHFTSHIRDAVQVLKELEGTK